MRKRAKRSFTLVETVMTIMILGIVAGVGFFSMVKFYELWNYSAYRLNILWDSRYLMRDLVYNLRMINNRQSVYIANSTRFRFINAGTGNITDYQFADGKLYKDGAQIIPELTAFTFRYYDAAGGEIVSPLVFPSDTNIRSIRIDFTLSREGETIVLRSTVKCRNLY